ncbi:MAG: flagellar brake protein [Candidatus Competibacteraceae bacterium]|nr:flagellar brake protein [Candidatus Competibacteraceae bacterium]
MLDRPKTDAGSFSALQEGQECVIRFIHEGMACAYNAHVIDWDTRRHNPYLRITCRASCSTSPSAAMSASRFSCPAGLPWRTAIPARAKSGT